MHILDSFPDSSVKVMKVCEALNFMFKIYSENELFLQFHFADIEQHKILEILRQCPEDVVEPGAQKELKGGKQFKSLTLNFMAHEFQDAQGFCSRRSGRYSLRKDWNSKWNMSLAFETGMTACQECQLCLGRTAVDM